MKFALFLSLALFVGATWAARDFCVLPPLPGRDFWAGPIAPLKNCFNSVPFNQTQSRQSAYILSQVASMYSFSDIVMNSGAPWNLTVDLRGQVKQLQVNVETEGYYKNDYTFHGDAVKIFNQLFDAHTQYRLPMGYLNGTFVRPFSIQAKFNSDPYFSSNSYYLAQGPLGDLGDQLYREMFGINLSQWIGYPLDAIDGIPIDQYVRIAADKYFTQYKDPQVRFNAMIRQKGWAFVPLQHFTLDQFPATTTIGPGSTFPNLIIYPGGLSSMNDLLQKNRCSKFCVNGTVATVTTRQQRRKTIVSNPHDEKEEIFQNIMTSLKKYYKETPKKTAAALDGMKNIKILASDSFGETQFGVFYDFSSGRLVPVFRLRTFLPRDLNGSIDTMTKWVSWAASNDAEATIIDVAHNGGGIICLADYLLAVVARPWQFLNSNTSIPPAYGVYDFRHSPITDRIIKSPFYQPQFLNGSIYLSLFNQQAYAETNTSWYNGPTQTRGGATSQYTIKNYFPNECSDYASKLVTNNMDYFFKNVTVITDGTCGSACALFTAQLLSHRNLFQGQSLRVATFCGNKYGDKMDTASFAGGNVLDTMELAEIFSQTGFNDTNLPLQFPTSAIARFNFHEYYVNAEAPIPREFTKLPADWHLYGHCDALWNDDWNTEYGDTAAFNLYRDVLVSRP